MKLHELSPNPGSTKKRKRLGRGPGSGVGKTAGRGHNGQRSRAGFSQRLGFEGGQMPLIRRVPKRGFTNIFRKEYAVVNIVDLVELEETTITKELLVAQGIVRAKQPVKLLGDGEIDRALTVRVDKYSASAKQKIEAAGGTCEEPSS